MDLENAEEILQILERYTKQKSKTIPDELNSYLTHVALTGDSVYSWSKVQYFFREKLAHVIKEFHDTTPRTEDLPVSRNVDAFNYDSLKTTLLERFDLFNAAPFTIQRLSELLNEPKKHYCRLDKFMRALEKNILVVSTVEPGHRTMGSENGDSINGDPLMDINVDVEMDKEPSSSSVSPTEKSAIEAQPEPNIDEPSTDKKTEQGTSEQNEEPPNNDGKVSTNGHHNNELDDKIVEDAKIDDEQTTESSDKTDDASSGVETITVELQPAEIEQKVNSPEASADVIQPILETADVTSSIEQSNGSSIDAGKQVDGKESANSDNTDNSLVAKEESIVEKAPQNIPEGVKHSREHDGDEDDYQPTAAKLSKMEDEVTTVEEEALPESEKVDIGKIDEVAPKETDGDDQSANEIKDKEIVPETVLDEISAPTSTEQVADQTAFDEKPNVEQQPVVEETVVDELTPAIPTDIENDLPDTIETSNDTSSNDNTISPLASTLSNDLDILEDDDDDDDDEGELLEPSIADSEPNILEPSTVAETDVEMLPLKAIDNPEQMAVEDQTAPVLSSTSSDLAMDATQIIPPTSDEQMDVLESNLMDEDL